MTEMDTTIKFAAYTFGVLLLITFVAYGYQVHEEAELRRQCQEFEEYINYVAKNGSQSERVATYMRKKTWYDLKCP